MTQAKRSLGPEVWACLGSSGAFRRTRSHLQSSIVSGDDTCQETDAGDVKPSLPDISLPPPGCSAQAVPKRGMDRIERHAGRRKTGFQNAQKGGTSNVGKKKEQEPDKEDGAVGGGWDRNLSETAALAIEAAMWTIATERERTTTCAAIAQGKISKQEGADENAAAASMTAPQHAAQGEGSGGPRGEEMGGSNLVKRTATAAALGAVEELRISMPTARRFIKTSRLIDGISVLDADVDLAFKRWEEVGCSARRGKHRSTSAVHADGGGACMAGRTAEGRGKIVFDNTPAGPLLRRQCEAVGCSDPARYGGIHPMAKATLCRKHRQNGMVDVGSRR